MEFYFKVSAQQVYTIFFMSETKSIFICHRKHYLLLKKEKKKNLKFVVKTL